MNFNLYEITPEYFERIVERNKALENGMPEDVEKMYVQRKEYRLENGIAYIDVFGPLKARISEMEEDMGYTSYEQIKEELQMALSNGAQMVVLSMNSGGGEAIGSDEVVQMIERFPIPVYAMVDSGICASACYKIACACTSILVSSSSEVGSIGSLIAFSNSKRAMNAAGVYMEVFSNDGAIYKSIGSDFGDLTDEQRSYIQEKVNKQGQKFIDTVKRNRPEVNEQVFSAAMYSADQALELGLIDSIF